MESGHRAIGIPELDDVVGGVPEGFMILVQGSPGSGTELFAKQFASAGVGKENVIYFTTNERDEDVKKTMEHFGWDPNINIVNIGGEYYEKVLAREVEISRYRQEGVTIRDLKRLREQDISKGVNFLTKVTYEISKLKPPFRVIIDSLDFFLEYYDPQQVMSALRTIKAHSQHQRGVVLVTMLKGVHEPKTESGVEEIVDAIIELEKQRKDRNFIHYLIIQKVRNHPERLGIMEYSVTNRGITPK